MLSIETLEDIAALRESVDIECKLALGKDGKGAFPKDAWETYSAFANSNGGDIFLGLKEKKDGSFELQGIQDTQKVLDEFWGTVANPQKISFNLMRDRWVKQVTIDGCTIIQIHVPAASRQQRPVYLNNNPLTGTYKRMHSGDMRQSEEVVKRMLAEQVEDSRDAGILKGYGLGDLDIESFNTYRQIYTNLNPDHPWNKLNAEQFLYQIGGWARDRISGDAGLTPAGLLMFGSYRPILEKFPNYMVDYQERPEARTEARWIDRLVPDGSWSGNVFDFYQKVIRKLTVDLKVPFLLEGDQRKDDTLVHKALREALVNSLVHADYTERASVLVVKRPDMFGFRNPGMMRVPVEQAIEGSHSDCRNRNLQNMFRFIGLGENAGSGLPKIFDGWNSQHWRKPVLRERTSPSEQTVLELHTLSLVPEKTLEQLREELGGDVFDALSDHERLILVTALIEKTIDHKRMMSVMDIHPRDLSALLSGLVEKRLIYQEGSGRATVYFLAKARLEDTYKESVDGETTQALDVSSGGLGVSSGDSAASSGGLDKLRSIAQSVSSKKKAPKTEVEQTILALCAEQPCSLEQLAELLNRSVELVRKSYLQPMIREKRLHYQYPTKPNHPQQRYLISGSDE
jgi:predicted HTH transcriptional regulator